MMMYKALLLLTIIYLQGCASTYSCGKFAGRDCKPVSSVYEATNRELNDYRKEGKLRSDGRGYDNLDDPKPDSNVHLHIARAEPTLNYMQDGNPLLTKPVVMRILFNTWVDEQDDLIAGGYIYVKLKESKWFSE